ncbi:MAG: thioesterase family protein [Gammaproteobacteria bacterium]|nr:thioesterase family protein [Gammaproteobacteria bacterium]
MTKTAIDPLPEGYHETYRGHVPAWETDDVEHFTVAYYFERIERAASRFLVDMGLDATALAEVRHLDFFVRYTRELRISSVFAIQTGIIEHAGQQLHLAHKVVDLSDGQVCTTIEHHLEGQPLAGIAPAERIEWDGPARDTRIDPADDAAWIRTGTDIILPGELDWSGRFRLSGFVHRFSGSGGQLMTRFGWTPEYEERNRVGFSTFEFQFKVSEQPRAGEAIDVEACVAHIGRSSVHIVHRVLAPGSRRTLAVLHQLGVHLDKDARRPSPLPEHIRAAALGAVAG